MRWSACTMPLRKVMEDMCPSPDYPNLTRRESGNRQTPYRRVDRMHVPDVRAHVPRGKHSTGSAPGSPGVQECTCEVENADQGSARGGVHNAARHAGRCPSNGGTGAERVFGRRTG